MDLDFTPEELAFRDEVRAFLAAHLPERLREGARNTPSVFVEPDIGDEWHRILHARGWVAWHWPKEFGGTGWDPVRRYIFEKELALADAPALSILGLRLVGPVLCRYGTPEQQARFLPRILDGSEKWCQGYSEPGAGSDLASLKTRAERRGDRYILNGTKIWTTHAHYADWMFCLARTDPQAKPQAGISFLLVPMRQPGITIRPIVTLAGDHEVNQVFLDDAETRVEWRVGEEGQGWEIAKFLLENERGGSCAAPRILVDIARLKQAAEAEPSGANGALGRDPELARRLARLELEALALETTELRILADQAKGRRPGPQASLVKLIAANLRQAVDELAVEIFGPLGLQLPTTRPLYGNAAPEPVGSRAAQLAMASYLNGRAWTIFGGTNEVQKGIIARQVLGL
ncbi:MAG: acyl-CoA dehydrogenase family protein [Sphingomonadaceae bacterium]|uniref:acyl-CoA dehydrogenase family protein n=1 Tax=Thermaurantiacus sp. TaxID=2820283 RepID=UPI00298EDE4E|nr:acyl-CoA dehydrogenase family protein [Thermaurantiacus sp.]MCS6987149.1 acyl-CoA dehydrogenase family protein [Sphingomonadaceae bacterium]MDW8415817.1 acyl-CoA dehydrogenase family protein [Thermaurantiacus sp.]